MRDARSSKPEGPTPFLEGEPPPLVARGLSLFLISLFVVASVLAAVIELPETVTATFVLVPLRGTDPIRAPGSGRVDQVHVLESARVVKGKVLITLQAPGAANGQIRIEAPCDGTILKLGVKNDGTIVRDGDTLVEIACVGERLQAELTVPQGGLSRLRPGHGVKLLFEAFPYQRFGVRAGYVRWVSPSGATAGGPPVFRAFAELEAQTIRVDGEDRPFSPGMKGDALIVVGRRSVLSYVLDPLRQLREATR